MNRFVAAIDFQTSAWRRHLQRLIAHFGGAVACLDAWDRLWRDRRCLESLDARLLADVGITRIDTPYGPEFRAATDQIDHTH